MSTIDPFDVLLDLEKRCRLNAERLPAAGAVENKWVGVGFRLGDDKLIADMSEVEEILDVPRSCAWGEEQGDGCSSTKHCT